MDFNPDFAFSLPGAQDDDAAHPWEFKGALAQAEAAPGPKLTSLDEKIKANLNRAKERQNDSKARKAAAKQAKKRPRQEAFADSESDDSMDQPLPGEDMPEDDGVMIGGDSDDDQGEAAVVEDSDGTEGSSGEEGASDGGEEEYSDDAAMDSGDEAAEHLQLQPAGGEEEEEEEEEDSDEEGGGDRRRASHGVASTSAGFFSEVPTGTSFSAKGFADLALSRPLVKACTLLGYTQPTPIQAACIPLALMGRDIVGSAQTGSGKTAAFALPLLERLLFRQKRIVATHVLVLTPTRELAVQVHSMICKLGQFTDIRAALVVGGLSLQKQAVELRSGPEIVVATPGRIIDHVMNTMSFEIDSLSALVLDEADRLLELGFLEEIRQVVKLSPRKRQTLLFSATMTDEVQKLVELSLSSPVRLAADAQATTPARLRQEVLRLKGATAADKDALLMAICARSLADSRTIIFCAQKWKVHRLTILMGLAELPPVSELHGDMTQAARLEALERFRTNASKTLIATDVAARGLDILGVQTIINYDCPKTLETYLHRIGRTARAGNAGLAISFVEDGDRALLKDVVKKVKARLTNRVVPKAVVAGWRQRLEKLYGQVEDVLQDERQEKAFRKAEMEATKAVNMMEHEAEIYARPKREWFQTAREKQAVATAAKDDAAEETGKASKGAKAARNALVKGAKQEAKRQAPKHVTETEREMGTVKAAKAAARHLRETGQRPQEASKAALTAVGVKKREKQKKRKVDSIDDDGDLGARAPKVTHVYAGGGKSGSAKRLKTGPSKAEKAHFARGGKGKSQFKGKSRFKRR